MNLYKSTIDNIITSFKIKKNSYYKKLNRVANFCEPNC